MAEPATKDLIKYEAKDGQMVMLDEQTVTNWLVHGHRENVTRQEVMFFMHLCRAKGMNPFKKDCYLVKYGQDPAAMITSINFMRTVARQQPDCQGWQKGIIVKTRDGEIKRTHGLILEGEELLGAWFEATPKGWAVPYQHEINLDGYIKRTKDGDVTRFWSKPNQPTMIMKVVEGQGLRALWPEPFEHIYTDAEVGDGHGVVDAEFTTGQTGDEGGHPEEDPWQTGIGTDFAAQIPPLPDDKAKQKLQEYLDLCSSEMRKPLLEIMDGALADFDNFWSNFVKWAESQGVKVEPTPPPKAQGEPDIPEGVTEKEEHNIRRLNNSKTSGMTKYLAQAGDLSLHTLPYLGWLAGKLRRIGMTTEAEKVNEVIGRKKAQDPGEPGEPDLSEPVSEKTMDKFEELCSGAKIKPQEVEDFFWDDAPDNFIGEEKDLYKLSEAFVRRVLDNPGQFLTHFFNWKEKGQDTEDKALLRALHHFSDADKRWAELKAKGATNAELKEFIGQELGIEGTQGGPGQMWVSYKGGKEPRVWFGTRSPEGEPALKGQALVKKVRELMDIPGPEDAAGEAGDETGPEPSTEPPEPGESPEKSSEVDKSGGSKPVKDAFDEMGPPEWVPEWAHGRMWDFFVKVHEIPEDEAELKKKWEAFLNEKVPCPLRDGVGTARGWCGRKCEEVFQAGSTPCEPWTIEKA